MVGWSGVRDPGAAGDLSQAEPVSTDLIQDYHGSVQQRLPQVAGEVLAHSARCACPGPGMCSCILD
jgi:hypothetical protein